MVGKPLPFIWLGSVCAQPNLNLANGCLAYLAMLVGVGVTALCRPLGIAILAESLFPVFMFQLLRSGYGCVQCRCLTMRCSEPGESVAVAIVASRGPGR